MLWSHMDVYKNQVSIFYYAHKGALLHSHLLKILLYYPVHPNSGIFSQQLVQLCLFALSFRIDQCRWYHSITWATNKPHVASIVNFCFFMMGMNVAYLFAHTDLLSPFLICEQEHPDLGSLEFAVTH